MRKDRHKVIPAVYLVMNRKNSILLMRRRGSGYKDGQYGLPSGHLEPDESLRESLVREVREETGVQLGREDLSFVHVMHRHKPDEGTDRMDFFFSATNWSGEPRICEPHKCDDMQWFDRNALPENMVEEVAEVLGMIEHNVNISERDF